MEIREQNRVGPKSVSKMQKKKYAKEKEKKQTPKKNGHRLEVQCTIAAIGE
jgi:hypothetical protein